MDTINREESLKNLDSLIAGHVEQPGPTGDLTLLALRLGLRFGRSGITESDLDDALQRHGYRPAQRSKTSVAMPGSIVDQFDQLADMQ